MTVGILALQGDVAEHRAVFERLGVEVRAVRRPGDLDGLTGIVLPGGESTTLSLLLGSSGLFEPLADAIGSGLATFGTCAGLILLARTVLDGRPDQRSFGALGVTVRRNGYGRQLQSFEASLDASKLSAELGVDDVALPGIFIRAPRIEALGVDVEVLVTLGEPADPDAVPVVCRQANVLASTFHPELTGDDRLHRLFVALAND
jgi:pyridoxal 5'-phosphate synthase pdxT subunit